MIINHNCCIKLVRLVTNEVIGLFFFFSVSFESSSLFFNFCLISIGKRLSKTLTPDMWTGTSAIVWTNFESIFVRIY